MDTTTLGYRPVSVDRQDNLYAVNAFLLASLGGMFSMVLLFIVLCCAGLWLWNPLDRVEYSLALGFIFLPELVSLNLAAIGLVGILLHRRSQGGIAFALVAIALNIAWFIQGYLLAHRMG